MPKDDVPCHDCGMDTTNEYYIVDELLWNKAIGGHEHYLDDPCTCRIRFLCIGCLECRIGRRLFASDFPSPILVACNYQLLGKKSARLLNRMNTSRIRKRHEQSEQ